jgi:hypothetical protein
VAIIANAKVTVTNTSTNLDFLGQGGNAQSTTRQFRYRRSDNRDCLLGTHHPAQRQVNVLNPLGLFAPPPLRPSVAAVLLISGVCKFASCQFIEAKFPSGLSGAGVGGRISWLRNSIVSRLS